MRLPTPIKYSQATTFLDTSMSSTVLNLDEEAKLYTTNAEREKYGLLATLFGIIVALDYLERAYVRDSVTAAEYVVSDAHAMRLKLSRLVEEVLSSMYKTIVTI